MNFPLDPEMMISPDFDPMDAVEIFDIVNRQDWGMRVGPVGNDLEGV